MYEALPVELKEFCMGGSKFFGAKAPVRPDRPDVGLPAVWLSGAEV